MLISVVIPAFNVENCISRSIESVLRQKFSDIELIIVDDGSSDDTGFICDKFKTIDSRIKVIHQKNSGVSEARNTGIINSTGDYLFFLDADDWLSLDYFISVYHLLKLKQYSFVFTPYYEVPKNSLYIPMVNFSDTMIFEKEEMLSELFLKRRICWAPFACFYRRTDILNVHFNRKYKFGEDLLFKYESISNSCDKAIYFPFAGYYYDTTRADSATNSYSISKKVDDISVLRRIMDSEPNYRSVLFYNQYIPCILYYALSEDFCSDQNEKNICISFKNEIMKLKFQLLFSNKISIKTKIKILLLLLPKCFRILYFRYWNKKRGIL